MNKEVKEVERRAKVGEWVKVVNPDGTHYDEYKKGDILQIVEYKSPNKFAYEWRAYYKNETRKYLNKREYVVLENYNPDEKETPTEWEPKLGDIVETVYGMGEIVGIAEQDTILYLVEHGHSNGWFHNGKATELSTGRYANGNTGRYYLKSNMQLVATTDKDKEIERLTERVKELEGFFNDEREENKEKAERIKGLEKSIRFFQKENKEQFEKIETLEVMTTAYKKAIDDISYSATSSYRLTLQSDVEVMQLRAQLALERERNSKDES